jgi:hypothetical protein
MEPNESQKAWGKVVARAWSDELFKKRLFADPKTVLKEHGLEMPADVNVKVMEDSGKTVHLILPERPSELTVDELSQVAGGQVAGGSNPANLQITNIAAGGYLQITNMQTGGYRKA